MYKQLAKWVYDEQKALNRARHSGVTQQRLWGSESICDMRKEWISMNSTWKKSALIKALGVFRVSQWFPRACFLWRNPLGYILESSLQSLPDVETIKTAFLCWLCLWEKAMCARCMDSEASRLLPIWAPLTSSPSSCLPGQILCDHGKGPPKPQPRPNVKVARNLKLGTSGPALAAVTWHWWKTWMAQQKQLGSLTAPK